MEEQSDAHHELLQSNFSETTVSWTMRGLHYVSFMCKGRSDETYLPSSDSVCMNNR